MAEQIKTLQDFYKLIRSTVLPKQYLLEQSLNKVTAYSKYVDELKEALDLLAGIPKSNGLAVLALDDNTTIELDLSYEISELKADLFFLGNSLSKFYHYLAEKRPNFTSEKNLVVDGMQGHRFRNFITDRDGTINNYCGRYGSSVQSIYNAYFLTIFARKCVQNAVIITSAPLMNNGLTDVVITSREDFILAGSKGREYLNKKGPLCRLPIAKDRQQKLDDLNTAISGLAARPEYKKFTLIGSGLQFKHGETTLARQDIMKSVPEEDSEKLKKAVAEIVRSVDPEERYFYMEDTGRDIEIVLAVEGQHNEIKNFDKGDGLQFVNSHAKLKMNTGPSLVCGDTAADALMLPVAKKLNKNSRAIFVTEDKNLKGLIEKLSPEALFVSSPDTLIAALYELAAGLI